MRNLILLLGRYGSFLLFLFLELLCFFLIVQFNEGQSAILVNSYNNISRYVDERSENASNYLKLFQVVDSLAAENADLKERIIAMEDQGRELQATDSVPQFVFDKAQVINNSVRQNNNYLFINKGSRDSVDTHMGVIGKNGVVGIIRAINDRYSVAMSVLHRQSRISARLKNTNYFGTIVWKDRDPTRVYLDDVPKHVPLQKRDTIETSGYSSIFPPGIPIGQIDTTWVPKGSSSYVARVKLFEDLANLDYIYLVRNQDRKIIKELEQSIVNE